MFFEICEIILLIVTLHETVAGFPGQFDWKTYECGTHGKITVKERILVEEHLQLGW